MDPAVRCEERARGTQRGRARSVEVEPIAGWVGYEPISTLRSDVFVARSPNGTYDARLGFADAGRVRLERHHFAMEWRASPLFVASLGRPRAGA
jgi:hypothetical protein